MFRLLMPLRFDCNTQIIIRTISTFKVISLSLPTRRHDSFSCMTWTTILESEILWHTEFPRLVAGESCCRVTRDEIRPEDSAWLAIKDLHRYQLCSSMNISEIFIHISGCINSCLSEQVCIKAHMPKEISIPSVVLQT